MVAARPIVVQKYGGSSVADVDRIRAVARRVVATVSEGFQVAVVVSAMGNTTNELLALAHSVSPRPGRRELDLLVSVGERVSMTLLAMAIEDLGVPAASFTGSQTGIITDERHVSARVIEVRPWRVQRALDEGKVAIVAGFQGVSRAGEVTTLGRGGSDTTAVVLAAALEASHCEICSDVDGVWTADPRAVPAARKLETLPLDAAAALARAGTKVLLADAVERARRMGVQLHAGATHRPPHSGTDLPPGPTPDAVVGISADRALRLVTAAAPGDLALPALAGALRHAWRQDGQPHALVDTRNLPDLDAILAESPVRDLGPVATVSAVGRAVVTDPTLLATALDACGAPRAWGASNETFWACVNVDDATAHQQALHDALIG